MNITSTHLAGGSPGANFTSFTTASISPAANSLIILSVYGRKSGGGGNTPTVTGAGMTWTQIGSPGVQGEQKVTLFRALSPAPGSGVLTVDFGGQTQTEGGYSIDQFKVVNAGGSNGANAIVQSTQGGVATTSSQTLTLAALTNALNIAFGAFCNGSDSNSNVAGSGFTTLYNQGNGAFFVEYKLNTTTVNYSYVGNNDSAGVAVEIQVGAPVFGFIL